MHSLVPQSQLAIVSGCGHMAPVFCADQIAPKVIAFLQR
jgi:pimeloyl-ACP methyl ester carboxylesterase